MIHFACPSCTKKLAAGDEFAGKRVRCGGCQAVAVVPAAPEAVQDAPPLPVRSRRDDPPLDRPLRREDDDDRPRRFRDDDDHDRPRRLRDDDDDDRPRRRMRRRTEWKDCPKCGAVDPAKVSYTWWGGFIGPAIINTVRCQECGQQYNGIHGDYNTTRIVIYSLVCLGMVVPFVICAGIMGAMS